MNRILILITISLLTTAGVFSQNTPPITDVQVWNETTVTVPLIKKKDSKGKETEKLSVFFNGVLRVGRNVSHFVDERVGFGFEYKFNKYVSFTPAYLYVAAQPFQGRRDFESRLRFSVNLEKKFKNFSVRDRNMIEYRFRNSRANSTRYRNKLQFNIPVMRDKKELFTPFIADEVYYDFREKEWTRNEFSAGISKKINKNFTMDFFYLFRNTQGTSLKYVNAFGVNLKIKID